MEREWGAISACCSLSYIHLGPARSGRTPHSEPEYQSSSHALLFMLETTKMAASYPYLSLCTRHAPMRL
jgi:hypothetical protein